MRRHRHCPLCPVFDVHESAGSRRRRLRSVRPVALPLTGAPPVHRACLLTAGWATEYSFDGRTSAGARLRRAARGRLRACAAAALLHRRARGRSRACTAPRRGRSPAFAGLSHCRCRPQTRTGTVAHGPATPSYAWARLLAGLRPATGAVACGPATPCDAGWRGCLQACAALLRAVARGPVPSDRGGWVTRWRRLRRVVPPVSEFQRWFSATLQHSWSPRLAAQRRNTLY
jgi:hypothetical protein